MWVSLLRKTYSDVCRRTGSLDSLPAVVASILVLLSYGVGRASARGQEAGLALPHTVQEQMDSLSSRLAEQIRQSKIDPAFPKFL